MNAEPTTIETSEEIPAWKKMGDQFNALMTPKEDEPKTSEKPAEADKTAPAVVSDKPKAEDGKVEKPAEPALVLNDAPPGNVVGKAADSWNAFKTKANKEISDRDAKYSALQKEMETVKKTVVTQPIDVTKAPEFEVLKKKHDEMEAQLKVVAIERHPQFVEYFGTRTKAALENAKSIVGAELSPILEKILRVADPVSRSEQLESLASELSPFRQGELASAISKIKDIEAERATEIEKAGKSYETLQTKSKYEQEQTTAQQKATVAKQKSDALALARKTMDAFKTKDGDDAHNAGVKQNEEFIENFFDGTIDPKLFAAVPALAAESMFLRQNKIPQLEADLKKRDEIIASYQSSKPNLDGGGDGGGEGKPDPNKSPEQNFAAGYAKIMAGG